MFYVWYVAVLCYLPVDYWARMDRHLVNNIDDTTFVDNLPAHRVFLVLAMIQHSDHNYLLVCPWNFVIGQLK